MNKQDSSSPLLNRLRKNLKQLKPYLEQHKISCYRVFDWDMPEYPLCIDFYEGKIHVSEYKTRHSLDVTQYEMWLSSCIDDIVQFFSIGPENLFLKERERHKGVQLNMKKWMNASIFFKCKKMA
jgi:23S rRNA (cytosine1962-C5)-methyltransferase